MNTGLSIVQKLHEWYHRWELPGNYPVFTVVMVLRESGEFSLPPFVSITYTIMNKYYPGEPVHIHIQSLINIIQGSNWVITIKKR